MKKSDRKLIFTQFFSNSQFQKLRLIVRIDDDVAALRVKMQARTKKLGERL